MNSTLMSSIRTLLANPDRPDRDALFKVFADDQASNVLACLSPPGSLLQIAAALRSGWSGLLDGWEQHTDDLVGIMTDLRNSLGKKMIATWSTVPGAVGVLHPFTDAMLAWADQSNLQSGSHLAILLGPSDATVNLLHPNQHTAKIARTLRSWSMTSDRSDPTAWQQALSPDLLAGPYQNADPSYAFPAWGWDDKGRAATILKETVADLLRGWDIDHPSIRKRIAWLEHHRDHTFDIGDCAILASIGGSEPLAAHVCDAVLWEFWKVFIVSETIPWMFLHPTIQTGIDTLMHKDQALRCAIGHEPVTTNPMINASLLLWRIGQDRWETLDPTKRTDLVVRTNIPDHCYGWGIHPDLIAQRRCPEAVIVRFWNRTASVIDLQAWAYADILRDQRNRQNVRHLVALLDFLPPDSRARFEPILDRRLDGRSGATARQPWNWKDWARLPAADRVTRLDNAIRLVRPMQNERPAFALWQWRNSPFESLVWTTSMLINPHQTTTILAALLAQVPALQSAMDDPGPPLDLPENLTDKHHAQIDTLALDNTKRAYAAWCLWILDRDEDAGIGWIALHPDIAVALAPILTPDQKTMVTDSFAFQGWDSMEILRWYASRADEGQLASFPKRI